MSQVLHITSGDCCGDSLARSDVPGEVFVWHDILYAGPPRGPGWPDRATLMARARFLEEETGGGLAYEDILTTLVNQYDRLLDLGSCSHLVLWFDACLFDQSMLAHILTCLQQQQFGSVELLCVEAFPGVEPFHGLGQLNPAQMAHLYGREEPVTPDQFDYAALVEAGFARQDVASLKQLAHTTAAPLPSVPAAAARWLEELPDSHTGLGRLATLALESIRAGNNTPLEIFRAVADRDTPPQYWGDITLWKIINQLADHEPPLVRIEGPLPRLPQWEGIADLDSFLITPED